MSSLGESLLATPEGVAFLACGAAVGRLEEALADPGLTLCLAAHAIAEVRRGTDGGRLATFVAHPGGWLLDAAATVDDADTRWWSTTAHGAVVREVDDHVAGVEVVDRLSRRRSAAEEDRAHLHTFSTRDRLAPPRRLRLGEDVDLLVVDRASDVDDDVLDALRPRVGSGRAPGVQLTLRGALTIPRATTPAWPWGVAGVYWRDRLPDAAAPEPAVAEPRVVHDYDWPPIGRPYDPRFDEGEEIDGSDLDALAGRD